MIKNILFLLIFVGAVIGSSEYLRKNDVKLLEIEKEMKVELAKYEIEKIKAQTNMYYAQAKLNQNKFKITVL